MKTANISRATAENLPFKVDHRDWLISIHSFQGGGYPAAITAPFGRVLHVQFDDVVRLERGCKRFSAENCRELVEFIEAAKTADEGRGVSLWAHCDAGICRSGAVVECLLLCGWVLDEDWANERIPNAFVFSHLRKALGFKFSFEE